MLTTPLIERLDGGRFGREPARSTSDPCGHLTVREREVLGLIAEGWSNRAICASLYITAKTLERHISNIYRKLDVVDRPGGHARVLATRTWLVWHAAHADTAAIGLRLAP